MLWCFLSLLSAALANFDISLDESSYTSSSTMKVSWSDDGDSPKVDDFSTATFMLCTYGSDGKLGCPLSLGKGVDISSSTSHSFDLSSVSSDGGSGSYLLQMTAIGSSSADYVINYYSSFVSITGMTGSGTAQGGSIPADTISNSLDGALESAAASDLPGATDSVPASYSNLASPWMTPYIYQHGLTRYAPFQSTPNSTVTASMTITRRNPTSSVSMFTTPVNTPLPVTTETPSPSITVTLVPNSASSFHASYVGRTASKVTPTAVYRERRWA